MPANKVAALRASGAELVIAGVSQDEAAERAAALERERGLTLVHPFDDPLVIAGQGTLALELLEQLPEVDTVLVPLSGGGLVSGVALALKAAKPGVRVVAVSAAATPVMLRSVVTGAPVELPEVRTLADSLGGGIGAANRFTLPLVSALVDEHVEVPEAAIGEAMAHLLVEERLVAEGGAAVGVAALLSGHVRLGRATAVVVSGRNVDVSVLVRLVSGAGRSDAGVNVVLVSEDELRRVVSMDREGLRRCGLVSRSCRVAVVQPPIMHIEIAEHNGEVDLKGAYVKG